MVTEDRNRTPAGEIEGHDDLKHCGRFRNLLSRFRHAFLLDLLLHRDVHVLELDSAGSNFLDCSDRILRCLLRRCRRVLLFLRLHGHGNSDAAFSDCFRRSLLLKTADYDGGRIAAFDLQN